MSDDQQERHLNAVDSWAASQLREAALHADFHAHIARRQFLQALDQQEFVPHVALDQAWDSIQRRGKEPPPDDGRVVDQRAAAAAALPELFLQARERELRSAVAMFRARFFDLTTADRAARRRELMEQTAQFPVLNDSLQRLDAVELAGWQIAEAESSPLPELAQRLCELYCCSPQTRATRRVEILAAIPGKEFRAWRRAAARLRRRHGQLEALDSPLIAALAGSTRAQQREKTRQDRAIRPRAVWDIDLGWRGVLVVIAVMSAAAALIARLMMDADRRPRRVTPELPFIHQTDRPEDYPTFDSSSNPVEHWIEAPDRIMERDGVLSESSLSRLLEQRELIQRQLRKQRPRPPREVVPSDP